MTPRILLAVSSFALCLALVSSVPAQDSSQPGKPRTSEPTALPELERRLKELEAKVANLEKEVAAAKQGSRSPFGPGGPGTGGRGPGVPGGGIGTAAPPPPAEVEFLIIRLKHAEAPGMVKILQQLFGATPERMRIVADPRTNSVLVHAHVADLEKVRKIIGVLDQPEGAEKDKEPRKR